MEKFNIEEQFNLFLARNALPPFEQLPEMQGKQLRNAFIGGITQFLVHLKESVPNEHDPDGLEMMDDLWNQVTHHWTHIIKRPQRDN